MRLVVILLSISLYANAQRQTIEHAEYFIGADPGEGKATQLNIQGGNGTVPKETWDTCGLPPITYGKLIYVRIKASGFPDNNGQTIPGRWSFPVAVKFPTTARLLAAQAKITRPGIPYPTFETVVPIVGAFDSVVQSLRVMVHRDSIKVGDTLFVRLQGKDEMWGRWWTLALDTSMLTDVKDLASAAMPNNPAMQIAPNPANGSAIVRYFLPINGSVNLEIVDMLGNTIHKISSMERQSAGSHELSFDVSALPVGVYQCVMRAAGATARASVMVVR